MHSSIKCSAVVLNYCSIVLLASNYRGNPRENGNIIWVIALSKIFHLCQVNEQNITFLCTMQVLWLSFLLYSNSYPGVCWSSGLYDKIMLIHGTFLVTFSLEKKSKKANDIEIIQHDMDEKFIFMEINKPRCN